jgi:hypothetical protein
VKILPSGTVCKSRDPLRASGARCAVRIEHVVTENLADGRLTLPIGEADDTIWALATRLSDGRTQWRRIELLQKTTTPEAAP